MHGIKDKILKVEEKIDKNKDKWMPFILPYLLISLIGRILDVEILTNLFIAMSFLLLAFTIIYFTAKFVKTNSIGILFVILGVMIFMVDGIRLLILSLTTNTPFLVVDKNTITYELYAFALGFIGAVVYTIEKLIIKKF